MVTLPKTRIRRRQGKSKKKFKLLAEGRSLYYIPEFVLSCRARLGGDFLEKEELVSCDFLVALHISTMSEAGQYGERGGLMQHEVPAPTASNTPGSGSVEAQLNTKPSSSPSTTTEHDFRFPRRPADHRQRQQPQGLSSSSRSQSVFGGTSKVPKGKLDFSGVDSDVGKDLLRESLFPTWKDDAAGAELDSPDEMQKKDPLATQIWRLYSKTKKQLPNQERLENLTWRMMAMSLRKRKQEDAARYVDSVKEALEIESDV